MGAVPLAPAGEAVVAPEEGRGSVGEEGGARPFEREGGGRGEQVEDVLDHFGGQGG